VNAPPSLNFPLGTQREGLDVLALLLLGTPNTLRIGLIAGGLGVSVGTLLGLTAGYLGGRADWVIRSLVDAGLTIPPLAVLILIAATFRVVTVEAMGLVVALTAWMYPARVIRSQAMTLRERTFVQVAKLSGAGVGHIVGREILPNLIPFLAAGFVGAVSSAMLMSVGLEILGLGSQRDITLGSILYTAILNAAVFRGLWWWWLSPIVMMVVIFLALFLLSVALDAYANPQRRGS
jgi:peptide/nickel transport system permease protein